MNKHLIDNDIMLLTKNGPRQIDYVKLIQNFTVDKVFSINMEDFQQGWALIPFGSDTYGLYASEKHTAYNLKDGSLNPKPPQSDEDLVTDEEGKRVLPSYIIKFNKQEWTQDRDTWKNYWHWKKNRNPVRSALEENIGFDSKHAMHLVRLLTMAEEILTTSEVNVYRPDADYLLAIRNGEFDYDTIVAWAESKDKEIREVLYKQSELPKSPDLKYAAKLLMELQDMCWSGQINLREVEHEKSS